MLQHAVTVTLCQASETRQAALTTSYEQQLAELRIQTRAAEVKAPSVVAAEAKTEREQQEAAEAEDPMAAMLLAQAAEAMKAKAEQTNVTT